jgi:hypothetical protein
MTDAVGYLLFWQTVWPTWPDICLKQVARLCSCVSDSSGSTLLGRMLAIRVGFLFISKRRSEPLQFQGTKESTL